MEKLLKQTEENLKMELSNEKTRYQGSIYHYTSADGLKSIIQSGKFWFSNAQFLNDSSETNYIFTLLPKSQNPYEEDLNNNFLEDIKCVVELYKTGVFYHQNGSKLFADYVYIASFSKSKDNLEMWNYYTKETNSIGYNIEFTRYPFDVATNVLKFIYGEVIYDRAKQEELVRKIVLSYNNIYKQLDEIINSDSNAKKLFLTSFVRTLELYNIFFKHKSYENEQEYRCAICNIQNYAGLNMQSRAINGLLVPYIEIPYERKYIDSIGISPASEKELLKDGVEFLWYANTKGEQRITVWSSDIPKRY